MPPSLVVRISPWLVLAAGCASVVREPSDGGGGNGGSGIDAPTSSDTTSSSSGTGAGPAVRELEVLVVAGWETAYPAPNLTVFSSDPAGALLATATTDESGRATLSVQDDGMVTAAAMFVYPPDEKWNGWTHLATSLVVTAEMKSAKLKIDASTLAPTPAGSVLLQIELPSLEDGWSYWLDDGCSWEQAVEPGTVVEERSIGDQTCSWFGLGAPITVTLRRDHGEGTESEVVGSACVPSWSAGTTVPLDLTAPLTWVDATVRVQGEALPSISGSWRLSSWGFAPVEMTSPNSYVASAPHPTWIVPLTVPLPFYLFGPSDGDDSPYCDRTLYGQRAYGDGQLELDWQQLARPTSNGDSWSLQEGAIGDFVWLSAAYGTSGEALWWDVQVPANAQGIIPPWLEAPEELSAASVMGSDLFRHADEVPATWELRAHEEFVGLDYADVTGIEFDPKADGVTRLRASCYADDVVTVR